MPIKTANSSNRAELIEFFFGASFVFEYRRCTKIFPELPVWRKTVVAYVSLETLQNPNNQQFSFPEYLGTSISVMPSELLHSVIYSLGWSNVILWS